MNALTCLGAALSTGAALLFGATVFFGDMFLKTDDQLRRTMDAVMWCLVLGLLALSMDAFVRGALHR